MENGRATRQVTENRIRRVDSAGHFVSPKNVTALASTRHGVALATQFFGEFSFHFCRSFKGHRVETFVKFRQQANAKVLHDARRLNSVRVIVKTFLGRKSGHADINTRFDLVALWICFKNFTVLRCLRIQQHDIDVVMKTTFRSRD